MEVTNLLLTRNNKAVSKLVRSYCNNEKDRKNLTNALIAGDPFDINVPIDTESESNTTKINKTFFRCLGIEINQGRPEEMFKEFDEE